MEVTNQSQIKSNFPAVSMVVTDLKRLCFGVATLGLAEACWPQLLLLGAQPIDATHPPCRVHFEFHIPWKKLIFCHPHVPKKILPHVQLYPQKMRRSCAAQESHGIMALFAMATIASIRAGPLVPSLLAPRCGRAAPRPPRVGSGGNAAAVVATAALARSKRRRGKAKPMPEDQVGWGGFSSLKVICELILSIFCPYFFHIFSIFFLNDSDNYTSQC